MPETEPHLPSWRHELNQIHAILEDLRGIEVRCLAALGDVPAIKEAVSRLDLAIRGNGTTSEGLRTEVNTIKGKLEEQGVLKRTMVQEVSQLAKIALAVLIPVGGTVVATGSSVRSKVEQQTSELVAVVEEKSDQTATKVAEAAEVAATRGVEEASAEDDVLAELARLRAEIALVKRGQTAVLKESKAIAQSIPRTKPRPAPPASAPEKPWWRFGQ